MNTACFILTPFKENLWYNCMILDDTSQILQLTNQILWLGNRCGEFAKRANERPWNSNRIFFFSFFMWITTDQTYSPVTLSNTHTHTQNPQNKQGRESNIMFNSSVAGWFSVSGLFILLPTNPTTRLRCWTKITSNKAQRPAFLLFLPLWRLL